AARPHLHRPLPRGVDGRERIRHHPLLLAEGFVEVNDAVRVVGGGLDPGCPGVPLALVGGGQVDLLLGREGLREAGRAGVVAGVLWKGASSSQRRTKPRWPAVSTSTPSGLSRCTSSSTWSLSQAPDNASRKAAVAASLSPLSSSAWALSMARATASRRSSPAGSWSIPGSRRPGAPGSARTSHS